MTMRGGSTVATAGEAGSGVADVVGYRRSLPERTATIASPRRWKCVNRVRAGRQQR